MNKQQTAIDFFNEQIRELEVEFEMTLISKKDYWLKRNVIVEQAKQLEKQQIIDAFWNGDNSDCTSEQNSKEFAEKYYNETFNK
jgi:hypothetical protein